MDELVDRIVADTGVDPGVARNAVIVILKFLLNESNEPDEVARLIDDLPGARAAMESSDLGGSAGLTGALSDLSAAGVGMFKIQSVVRSFGAYARERVGKETADRILASVPAISAYV